MLTRIARIVIASALAVSVASPSLAAQRKGTKSRATSETSQPYSPFFQNGEARRARGEAAPSQYGGSARPYPYGPYPDRPYGDPGRW